MSTAVDTAFEAIVSSRDEAPDELHAVCAICFPPEQFGRVRVVALCGHEYPASHEPDGLDGDPKCAKCVALSINDGAPWPCGH